MENGTPQPARVAIVGAGSVGATYAHALLYRGLAAEIVLINRDKARAVGEAMDLTHAVPFAHPTRIWAGEYADCASAAITIIAAGAPQGGQGSRLDLARDNGEIFKQIVPEVARHNPDGIVLVASNPVDALTYAAWKLSGLRSCQVIGSGTILDTSRFCALLGEHFGLDPRDVHAYVIGEHGESAVPVWSLANIAGMRLSEYCAAHNLPCDQASFDEIFRQTLGAAREITERKDATYYGVAGGLLRITEAILRDQHSVLAVSSLIEDYEGVEDVAFSLPSVVDRGGIARVLHPALSEEERDALKRSATILKEATAELDLD